MEENIELKIKKIVAKTLNLSEDKLPSKATFSDLGIDSLENVDLILALENEFEIHISDEEASKITNIHDAVEFIKKHKNAEN